MSDIHDILKKYWGYDCFRPLQEEIITSVLSGKDTLGLMPTGGGKSITFQVPSLAREGICIVVTPLISLMKDQVDNLRERGVKSAYVYSGMTRHQIIVTLENCIFGKYKFLYISPERLNTELFLAKLSAMHVSLLVVDEAHCISQWGYDFRPSYLQIAEIRSSLPGVPILALTATATPEVTADIQRMLRFRSENVFRKSFNRPNLSYIVRRGDDKMQQLMHILNRVPGSAIVYVRSRRKTKEIAEELTRGGIQSDYYHAGLSSEIKESKQQAWKDGICRVIVATNAFGMGIDKPDVRLVVHADLPNSPEEYYQEAGRAGRDEKKAYAVALYAKADKAKLQKRISDTFPERDFIRMVYDDLGNFFQIADGYGMNGVFDFNLTLFCQRFRLPMLPAHHALKILEQAQYIIYTEEVEMRSRIFFTMQRDDLYKLKNNDSSDRLVQVLLRLYTGVFADYVYINEDEIASRASVSPREVYENLVYLSKTHVIDYIPRKRTPYITYIHPREEGRYITISREVYEVRKERYAHRINSLLRYVDSDNECRTGLLLGYFGEKDFDGCGSCDICLGSGTKRVSGSDFENISSRIRSLLLQSPAGLDALVGNVPYDKEKVIDVLRYLCDEQYVINENNSFKINLKKK